MLVGPSICSVFCTAHWPTLASEPGEGSGGAQCNVQWDANVKQVSMCTALHWRTMRQWQMVLESESAMACIGLNCLDVIELHWGGMWGASLDLSNGIICNLHCMGRHWHISCSGLEMSNVLRWPCVSVCLFALLVHWTLQWAHFAFVHSDLVLDIGHGVHWQ